MALTEEQIAWLRRGLAMTPEQRLDWLMAAREYEMGLIDFEECEQPKKKAGTPLQLKR